MSDSQKYPVLIRLLHWLMAIGILGLIGSGWFMADLDQDVSYKYDIYPWHKSFGILILFAFVIRLILRVISSIPKLPHTMPGHEKKLAHSTHHLLYLMMFLVPASGYLMSSMGGRDTFLFKLKMPDIADNEEWAAIMHTIHEYSPYVLLGIIGLHVLGVLKHKFMDLPEHDVLKRML
ncbi:hypothetical protein ACH42_02730 [Endozoicomonas sp. (ex Bugula neritina AB1)]|nr:hypothetical protein ACH42_02730 [Endozoicomonas sp. (ex Bugula neritina AB1)]